MRYRHMTVNSIDEATSTIELVYSVEGILYKEIVNIGAVIKC